VLEARGWVLGARGSMRIQDSGLRTQESEMLVSGASPARRVGHPGLQMEPTVASTRVTTPNCLT
jgi:hypothetical protein